MTIERERGERESSYIYTSIYILIEKKKEKKRKRKNKLKLNFWSGQVCNYSFGIDTVNLFSFIHFLVHFYIFCQETREEYL
jgi:hypothetical protein